MTLSIMQCPRCGKILLPRNEVVKPARTYDACIRFCEKCEVGFSNSKNKPTLIYKNFPENIPEQLRQGVSVCLDHSINETHRKDKKRKFGFSSSEDALTWSFFKYFVHNNKFKDLLFLLNINSEDTTFDIYLWGTKINTLNSEIERIGNFIEVSKSFRENPSRMTEPDVMINLSDKLVFIEVKYTKPNDIETDKKKFAKYSIQDIEIEGIIESGHYELFRNWAFASKLSNGKAFELINLAPEKKFKNKNKNKLIQFEESLKSANGKFVKLSWEEILAKVKTKDYDTWFKVYLDEKLIKAPRNQ